MHRGDVDARDGLFNWPIEKLSPGHIYMQHQAADRGHAHEVARILEDLVKARVCVFNADALGYVPHRAEHSRHIASMVANEADALLDRRIGPFVLPDAVFGRDIAPARMECAGE